MPFSIILLSTLVTRKYDLHHCSKLDLFLSEMQYKMEVFLLYLKRDQYLQILLY